MLVSGIRKRAVEVILDTEPKKETKADPLLNRVSADLKIFLNEKTRVPHILWVNTYWTETSGIDNKGGFRATIAMAPGMVSLADLVSIKYHVECDLNDITVLVEKEDSVGRYNEYRIVLEMPVEWWRHPLHEYGQGHIQSLVKDMKTYATRKAKEREGECEETQLDFPVISKPQ